MSHSAARHPGYVNVLATAVAVFVSLVSLWLAYNANKTQEKLLAASSWPYLRFSHGNFDADHQQSAINVRVSNGGVGPAIVHWVVLRYKGQPVGNLGELVNACCTMPENRALAGQHAMTSPVTNTVISAADDTRIFGLVQADENKDLWEQLNRERWKLNIDACYCSIIGECWLLKASSSEPESVGQCPVAPKEAWSG